MSNMSDMLLKLLSRLIFLALLLVIIPLAVQNRQLVNVELNPLALINDALSFGFTLPLFILLIVTLFIGLAAGLIFGWGMARLQARKKAGKLKRAMPPAPIPRQTKMLEAEPQDEPARADRVAQVPDNNEAKKNVG